MNRSLATRFALSAFVASSILLALACGGDDSTSPVVTADAGSSDAAQSHDALVDQSAPGSSSCSGGTITCGSACVDPKVDPTSCGTCGKACAKGELCSAGTCATSCAANLTECGGDAGVDLCVSTKTDNANCGACGNVCPSGTACSNGACVVTCQSSLVACPVTSATPDGGAPDASADGGTTTTLVCTDLARDDQSCGACGNVCASGTVCAGGHCDVSCGAGKTRCDRDAGSSCAELKSDPSNCGACGKACAVGQACSGGVCGAFCNDKVLFLGDADAVSDQSLADALTAYGLSVTVVANGSATYDGVTPPLSSFGAVYLGSDSYQLDPPSMGKSGEEAILAAFNAGTIGVVLSGGWTAGTKGATAAPILAPLMILSGGTNYTVGSGVDSTTNHPIWNGVPASFAPQGMDAFLVCTDCSASSGAKGIAALGGSNVVAVVDGPGRVVGVGWYPLLSSFAWQGFEPQFVHVVANALKWSARCDVPVVPTLP